MSQFLLICLTYLSILYIYVINLAIYLLFSAVRHPPSAVRFFILQSPPEDAFLTEMVRSATQHCLCWPRMLTVLLKKGPI